MSNFQRKFSKIRQNLKVSAENSLIFSQTIFEMNKSQKSQALAVMQAKRKAHEPRISTVTEEKRKQKEEKEQQQKSTDIAVEIAEKTVENAGEDELAEVFGTVIGSTKHTEKSEEKGGKKRKIGTGKRIDRAEQMKFERVRDSVENWRKNRKKSWKITKKWIKQLENKDKKLPKIHQKSPFF